MTSTVKDKILLYRIRSQKDKAAFAELYDKYVESVYRFVYFKISNPTEAEDVTSEVFLKAWDYLTKTPDRSINSFRGLVYKIARNCVIDVYRDRAKRQEFSIEAVPDLQSSEDIASNVEINYELERITVTMLKLKQEYQEVIQLKHIEGLSIREIASVLGKRSGAIRVTLHRAIKKLKELSE
jgi:RNA polymerase sigma-70 factor, ECF subfamily